ILLVLAALREAAPNQVVDHAAGGGQRHVDELGGLLERALARLVLEVVQQLDLGQRELQGAKRLEQVGVAVLVHEDDQCIEVRGQFGVGRGSSCFRRLNCLHARKYCIKAMSVQGEGRRARCVVRWWCATPPSPRAPPAKRSKV